jgi:hypothetical protein
MQSYTGQIYNSGQPYIYVWGKPKGQLQTSAKLLSCVPVPAFVPVCVFSQTQQKDTFLCRTL